MNISLKDFNTGNAYDLTCARGDALTIINSGTNARIDSNGNPWTVTKGNYNTYHTLRVESPGYESYYSADEIWDVIPSLDLHFVGAKIDPISTYGLAGLTGSKNLDLGSADLGHTPPGYQINAQNNPDLNWRYDYYISYNFLGSRSDLNFIFRTALNENYSSVYVTTWFAPAVFEYEGGYIFGCIAVCADASSGFNKNIIYICLDTSITPKSFIEPDYDPGQKGFNPTGAYTTKNIPGNGGRGATNKKDPSYAGDSVSQPGAPNESVASAIGTGFINAYKITKADLKTLGECLWGTTLEGFLSGLFINPLDYIVSLCVFPCSPEVGTTEAIKLGRWECSTDPTKGLLFNSSGALLSSQFKVIDFGTLEIPENWGNFLDYSQTNIELYLPFVGSVSIDVSECMNGTINVQYTIDFLTGMCVANVLCTRSNYTLPSGKGLTHVHAQHAYQGNCAVQIPLSRADYGSMVGSLINACTQAITNPVGGFIGMAADAVGGGLRPNISSKGNIVANSGFCSVLYPYIRITRPITAEPESYQEVMGLPSYINTTLGQCQDLCVCDDIDLRGITGATESELNKIRQMCKDGVYV